jgi:hypothetical protein
MLVNGKQVEVVNSAIEWADRDLEWAVTSVVDALERREKAGLVDRLKAAIMEAFGPLRETSATRKDADMADEKQLNDLAAKVEQLAEAQATIGDQITAAVNAALKPVLDAQAEAVANAKAKDEAEMADLVAKIVAANLLDEDGAKELTLNAARKLAAKATPAQAAALNGAFQPNQSDDWAGYDLNANMEAK